MNKRILILIATGIIITSCSPTDRKQPAPQPSLEDYERFFQGPKAVGFDQAEQVYRNPSKGFSMPYPQLSDSISIKEEVYNDDPTSTVFFLDKNNWLIGVVYTQIRPEYPKDFTLVENKIKPTQDQMMEAWGKDSYLVKVEDINGEKILVSINNSPGFSGESDLRHMSSSSGGRSSNSDCKRVDFHLVRNGFYVQIISITNARGEIPEDQLVPTAKLNAEKTLREFKVGTIK